VGKGAGKVKEKRSLEGAKAKSGMSQKLKANQLEKGSAGKNMPEASHKHRKRKSWRGGRGRGFSKKRSTTKRESKGEKEAEAPEGTAMSAKGLLLLE